MNYIYMNISAAAIIIVTIIIRKVTINKIPHSIFGLLWGLAVVRMEIPFNILSDWSAYNLFFKLRDHLFANEVIALQYSTRQIQQTIINFIDMDFATKILISVWIIGGIVVGSYFVISCLTGIKLIRYSEFCDSSGVFKIKQWLNQYKLRTDLEIKISKEIDVPLSYGCFKPGILIPVDFDISHEINAKQIILHECMHIKYCHSIIKLLLAIFVSLSWFNPCAWILFKYINRDMEISCDRHVLELLGREQRESYALNLLKASQMQYKDSIVYSGFAKNSIKERIVAIMSFKKMSVFALVLSLSIPVSVATAFATTDNRYDVNQVNEVTIVEATESDIEQPMVLMSQAKVATYITPNSIFASKIYVDDFEYITETRSPDSIFISFDKGGDTYEGKITLYEMQVKNGKYYGYYHGWTLRV